MISLASTHNSFTHTYIRYYNNSDNNNNEYVEGREWEKYFHVVLHSDHDDVGVCSSGHILMNKSL